MDFLLSDLTGKEIIKIPFDNIIPNPLNPLNPMDSENIDKTVALAICLLEEGLTNPLIGEFTAEGKFMLNKGHSRRAAIELIRNNDQRVYSKVNVEYNPNRFLEVDCFDVMFDSISDSLLSMFRDNLLSKDMTPKALFKYISSYIENVLPTRRKEIPDYVGMPTRNMIAIDLGIKSPTTVQQHMAIAKAPKCVIDAFLNDKINMATAYELSHCSEELAQTTLDQIDEKVVKLTSKDVKKIINIKKSKEANKYGYAESLIINKFRTKAIIKNKKITISFTDDTDLNRVLELMGVIEKGGEEQF